MKAALLILFLVGCGSIDGLRPDVPENVADRQDRANELAFKVLNNLAGWIIVPELVPGNALTDTRDKIAIIVILVKQNRLWAYDNKIDKKIRDAFLAVETVWNAWIGVFFCEGYGSEGKRAWLEDKRHLAGQMILDLQRVFSQVRAIHKNLRLWMDAKGVM